MGLRFAGCDHYFVTRTRLNAHSLEWPTPDSATIVHYFKELFVPWTIPIDNVLSGEL